MMPELETGLDALALCGPCGSHPADQRPFDAATLSGPVQLSVVLPTYNEHENVPELLRRLASALHGLRWEAVFVDDDSPDGTAETVRAFAREDTRIRLLHRVGRRGLSSACIEGILASSADWVAVMDADMQHDETVLPRMLARARQESLDLVVGTRNADGGSMGDFARGRVLLSRLGERISHTVCKCRVSDPMSGFFVARRSFVVACAPRLQSGGFKILLDLFASAQTPVRFAEVGYTFRCRRHGESKLDVNTAVEYLTLVVNKLTRDLVPAHFVLFALVGTAGVAIHLACLDLLVSYKHEPFFQAQILATYLAMTANFFFNNAITYRDRSLHGLRLLARPPLVLDRLLLRRVGLRRLRPRPAQRRCRLVGRRHRGPGPLLRLELLHEQPVHLADPQAQPRERPAARCRPRPHPAQLTRCPPKACRHL